jgi:hypothetical protein
MAAKQKKTTRKRLCVYSVREHFTGPSEGVGLFSTRAKANAEARRLSKQNPRFDYSVTRICVK